MEEVESYDLVLLVKELNLSVKFPCRLTLQHAGRTVSPQIQSDGSNVFPVNRDVSFKEEKRKDYLEINVHLATDKGGNIMAGIIKINLKDIGSSQGDSLTISLHKCLDPYATCLLIVKSVKIHRSRVKKGMLGDDLKHKPEGRFESKSEAPVMDIRNFKPRAKQNNAESSFGHKRVTINQQASQVKEKALSTVGYRPVNNSFTRQDLASRFKHLGRKDEDNKTVTGKWRDVDQSFKASIEASEKTLKLQIIKYKTKYEESEKNLEQKSKQIKSLKEQISDLNRQMTQKRFIVEELNSKNAHITKLQDGNKNLSKQIHDDRNKIIDLERQLEQEKNSNFTHMSRVKEDIDKKEHDLQKSLYEKRQKIKQIMEENHYKSNQVNKMKGLIEDLESNLQIKTYEFDKLFSHEKTEHQKTKIILVRKISQVLDQLKKSEEKDNELSQLLIKSEQQNKRLQNKILHLDNTVLQQINKCKDELQSKQKQIQQRKKLQKVEEQLNQKIKSVLKDYGGKQKELEELNLQLSELTSSSKKKINELLEKNKNYTSKIQQLENKTNLLSASEQKLKRNLDMSQKEVKNLQENEKMIIKNSKLKDDRILQMERELTELQSKNNMKDSLGKKEAEYKSIQLEKMTTRVTQLERSYEREKETSQDRRLELLKGENKVKMLEEGTSRLNDQIKQIKISHIKRQDEWVDKIKDYKEQVKVLEAKESQYNKQIHNAEIQRINLKNEMNRLEKQVDSYTDSCERLKKRQLQHESTIKSLHNDVEQRTKEIAELETKYKILENEHRSLQADQSKTQKITSIIKEEKIVAVSDMNKLKKQIERREQKQQQYIEQIKKMMEEVTRWELKWNATSKQFQKYKLLISQNIKNLLGSRSPYASLDFNNNHHDSSRGFMAKSRLKASVDVLPSADTHQNRLIQIIENYSRESEQAIMMLNDESKKYKKEKQNLEKEVQNITARSNQNQEDTEKRIIELTAEIDNVTSQSAVQMEEYEERIITLEKQIKRRDKNINDLIQEIQELKVIQSNEHLAHESGTGQLLSKIHSLKSKLAEFQAKDEGNTMMFVSLEEKLASLESQNTQLIHQSQRLSQQLIKKQKECVIRLDHVNDLKNELQSVKKVKGETFNELLTLKENLAVERENLKYASSNLKDQENKNTQLKMFNAELLKEKKMLIQKEAELSQKINELQEKVRLLMVQQAEKNEELLKRQNVISEYKESSKEMHLENINGQSAISDLKLELERYKEKVKDRQRKIAEKEEQNNTLSAQSKKYIAKLESEINILREETQNLTTTIRTQQNTAISKINYLELEVRKLNEVEKKLNEANISLEEQIFFEKQMHSLADGKVEELNQDIHKLDIQNDKLNSIINELNQQIKQKEESLFALSGKLYNSDNKLESKEEEIRMRIEKADLEWTYKLEEICEEYETKIDLMERQRSYTQSDIEGVNQTVQRLENQKSALRIQIDRNREHWEAKLKKAQEEKLISLIEKNRQIEKIKEVFQELEQKMKKKDFELKTSEEDRRKSEEKLREFKLDVQKSDEKKNEVVKALEREIDQLKRKEGQLKRFKDALRNSQWTTERQIKKGIQNCAKTVINLTVQKSKDEVMNLMKNLENAMAKAACPNIDQI